MTRNNKIKWTLAIFAGIALSAFLLVGIPSILSDDSDRNKKQNLQPQELGEPPGYSYSPESGAERSANNRFGDLVDNNYETAGQARAGIPLVVGAGVVAGATAGYVGLKAGYNIGKYYSQPEDPGDVVNSTLRKSVHTDSIISAGSTKSFYDNQDNSLTTIEGSLKQRLSQNFLKEANNIKSEAEAVTTAETEATEYLRTTQNNIINSTNFFSQSVATYQSRLAEANASSDIYARSLRESDTNENINTIDVGSNNINAMEKMKNGDILVGTAGNKVLIYDQNGTKEFEFNGHSGVLADVEQLKDGRIASASFDNTVKIIDQKGNVDLTFSGHSDDVNDVEQLKDGRIASASFDNTVKIFDKQGNVDMTYTYTKDSGGVRDLEQLKDGRIASASFDNTVKIFDKQGNVDMTYTYTKDSAKIMDIEQLQNGNIVVSGQVDTQNFNQIRIIDQQGNEVVTYPPNLSSGDTTSKAGLDVEQMNNGKLILGYSRTGNPNSVVMLNKNLNTEYMYTGHNDLTKQVTVLGDGKIATAGKGGQIHISDTFNRSQITFDPSDVQNSNLKNTVKQGGKTYTGVNISLSNSYTTKSNAEMIVPYKLQDNGEYNPVDWQNGETVKIKTTTSGVSNTSEPLQYDRALKTIETRDSLSDQAYTFVSSYAKNVWSNTLQPVANDPNKSIYDEPNLTENLSVFEPPEVTRNNTEAILGYYVGIYEGTTDPTNDRMTLINNDTGEKFGEGVIFSTDMNELTGNKSKIEEGDILDTTNVSNSILVDSETADVNQLGDNTKYKVSNISSGSSVDVRTYDLKNTDLSEYAKRLEDAEEALEKVKNEPEDGVSLPALPGLPGFGGGNGQLILVILLVAGGAYLIGRD